MTTATYDVTGLTCEHCVHAVSSELTALDGVDQVTVQLVPDGVSTVSVTGAGTWTDEQVDAALDEAGEYQRQS